MSICGLSGSGKSVICEELKRDFVDLNPDQKFKILSFEFEMLASDQVARSLGGKLDKTTKQLYSAGGYTVGTDEFDRIQKEAKRISKYPIYYVDDLGTVDEIENTVYQFAEEHELAHKGEGLIITIDHVLLTKGRMGQSEKQIVDDLSHRMVSIKKSLSSKGVNVLIIMIGQLNRNIETPERILNNNLHYPNKNDIFGASSIFQCSDYVLISHKPAVIDGMTDYYGPERPGMGYPHGLPVFNPYNRSQPMVYWHLLKERFGEPKIIMMLDSFAASRVDEFYHQTQNS